jgi:sensor domain CHASE-containing protein
MSFQRKALLIGGALFGLLLAVIYIAARVIVNRGFSALEQKAVSDNVDRAVNALKSEIEALSSVAREWGTWDEAYQYVQSPNEKFAASNLTADNFEQIRLHVMMMLDGAGSTVFGAGFDSETKAVSGVPAGFREYLASHPGLLHHPDASSAIAGLIVIPEGPMIFASRPIVRGDGRGPVGGTVIMGRFLSRGEIARLAKTTRLNVAVTPIGASTPPVGIRPLSESEVEGTAVVADYGGHPGVLVRVLEPRSVYLEGRRTLTYLFGALAVAGFIFLGSGFLLFRHMNARLVRSVDQLRENTRRLRDAAVEVTSVGAAVAGGAARQGSSLDGVSTTIEELASLTRENVSLADKTDVQMKEALAAMQRAQQGMETLSAAMGDIGSASANAQASVRTIDELAFPTNILALNAAVEAARAGSAGSGFAVVAAEVRELALRSAQAARDTAKQIESTIAKVRAGESAAAAAGRYFAEAAEMNATAGNFVSAIAIGSAGQARRCEDAARSVADVAAVVQSNITTATLSERTSAHMHEQAEEMAGAVRGIAELLGATDR